MWEILCMSSIIWFRIGHRLPPSSLGVYDDGISRKGIIVPYLNLVQASLQLYHQIKCELWMMAGTRKAPRNIPIHLEKISQAKRKNLLALHVLFGCTSPHTSTDISLEGISWASYAIGWSSAVQGGRFSESEQFIIKLLQLFYKYDIICLSKIKHSNPIDFPGFICIRSKFVKGKN